MRPHCARINILPAPEMIDTEYSETINSRILAVSEDQIQGFAREPFREIARLSGLDESLVLERIRAMLAAGTIRRVRQTLLATNLAQGGAKGHWWPGKTPKPALTGVSTSCSRKIRFRATSLFDQQIRKLREAITNCGRLSK